MKTTTRETVHTQNATYIAPVPSALRKLMAAQDEWQGTATELAGLLADLDDRARPGVPRLTLPRNARGLGKALRQLAPDLEAAGIEVDFGYDPKTRSRSIHLRNIAADVTDDARDSAPVPHNDDSSAALVPFTRLSDVTKDDKDEEERDYTWYVLGALAALVGVVVVATSRR